MGLRSLLARFLPRETASEQRFMVGPDGSWPRGILPGGLSGLRGTHSDPPMRVQPWVDEAGEPHFFARPGGEQ